MDESDSEEEGDPGDNARFWLCVVVTPVTMAEATKMVRQTRVYTGEKYIIVRWLEMVDSNEMRYCLSHKEDCLSGRRALSLIPVKKMGKIDARKLAPNNGHGKAPKPVYYDLHKTNLAKIVALSK